LNFKLILNRIENSSIAGRAWAFSYQNGYGTVPARKLQLACQFQLIDNPLPPHRNKNNAAHRQRRQRAALAALADSRDRMDQSGDRGGIR
jgi:hypothetical protein